MLRDFMRNAGGGPIAGACTETRLHRRRTRRTGCDYLVRVPVAPRVEAAPLVSVHGISRNAAEHIHRFRDLADRSGALLVAPIFGRARRGYQQVRTRGSHLRADHDLIEILEDVGQFCGRGIDEVNLIGFSGGAQFAHRFTLLHPTRVRRLLAVSAGWYTALDPSHAFPNGTAPPRWLEDAPIDLDAFLRTPICVAVGARDTERDPSLRVGGHIDAQQGRTRIARARWWRDAVCRAARERGLPPLCTYAVLPYAAHSFVEAVRDGGLTALAEAFL